MLNYKAANTVNTIPTSCLSEVSHSSSQTHLVLITSTNQAKFVSSNICRQMSNQFQVGRQISLLGVFKISGAFTPAKSWLHPSTEPAAEGRVKLLALLSTTLLATHRIFVRRCFVGLYYEQKDWNTGSIFHNVVYGYFVLINFGTDGGITLC